MVSRAVSACTAIIEMWWATTLCSSRAILARSPRARWSASIPSVASRTALWVLFCSLAARAIAATVASGIADASSTASTRVSVAAPARLDAAPATAIVRPPTPVPASTSASARNGTPSATARTSDPARASRYATTSSAAAPAIVTSSNRTSDSTAARYTASAAGTGRSNPAGTVASRQNAHISSAVGAVTPAWVTGATASPARRVDFADSRATSSATESSPSSAPSATAGPGPGHRVHAPIVAAGQYGRIAPDGGPAVPRARDAACPVSHQAVTAKTAPSRDDRRVPVP